jgi:cytochrome c-type biogenesis protein CcmH
MPLDRLGSNSYVFIFARAPGGGPPIAGVRLPPDALPGTFTLSDANAIIAGRSLAAFPELAIVARISVGGDPIQQPGDLVAETLYRAGEETELSLTIDRVVE